MSPSQRPQRPNEIPLGIAGLPANEEDKRYIRQATLMLRYRLWLQGPKVPDVPLDV